MNYLHPMPLKNDVDNQNESQPSKKKRAKTSDVWKDLEEPKDVKTKCKYWKLTTDLEFKTSKDLERFGVNN